MKKLLLVVSFVVLLAFIRPVLWMYEFFIVHNTIPWSDVLNYCLNTCPGIIALIFSYYTFRRALKNEKISIELSKDVVRHFIERSCSGFSANLSGEDYHYYSLKYSNLIKPLQILKNANILEPSDMDLCKNMYNYVINLRDAQSRTDLISHIYDEFLENGKYKTNVKKILDKLN